MTAQEAFGAAVAAIKSAMKWQDADVGRHAGITRSQANRWKRGDFAERPSYGSVEALAHAVWRRGREDLARQLAAAAGYEISEPPPAPDPEPELDPELLRMIRRKIPAPDQQRVIDFILATMRGTPPPSGPPGTGLPAEDRRAS